MRNEILRKKYRPHEPSRSMTPHREDHVADLVRKDAPQCAADV
jgi:hypothetical protein